MAAARRLDAEVRRLQAMAEEAERAARDLATNALGEEYGRMVIRLVEGTLPADPSQHDPALAAEYPVLPGESADSAPKTAAAPPAAPRPAVQPRAETPATAAPVTAASDVSRPDASASPAAAPLLPKASAAARPELFGVGFSAAYRAEAEAIVQEAQSAASQRRRDNPYEKDRGKNAWRRQLFKAALLHFKPDDPAPDLTVRASAPETPSASEAPAVSETQDESEAADPLGEVAEDDESNLPVEAEPDLREAEAELARDDIGDERWEDREPPPAAPAPEPPPPPPAAPEPAASPPPARAIRPGFGASVPKPRNFTPPPGARPHPSQPRPVPSFMKRKES